MKPSLVRRRGPPEVWCAPEPDYKKLESMKWAHIHIVLEYQLVGEDEWHRQPLSKQEYFDPCFLETELNCTIDALGVYWTPVEHIKIPVEELAKVRFRISDMHRGEGREEVTHIWGGGRFCEAVRTGDSAYRRICLSLCKSTDDGGTIETIIHLAEEHERFRLVSHAMVRTDKDGFDTDESIFSSSF